MFPDWVSVMLSRTSDKVLVHFILVMLVSALELTLCLLFRVSMFPSTIRPCLQLGALSAAHILACCPTLGKIPSFSVLPFSHRENHLMSSCVAYVTNVAKCFKMMGKNKHYRKKCCGQARMHFSPLAGVQHNFRKGRLTSQGVRGASYFSPSSGSLGQLIGRTGQRHLLGPLSAHCWLGCQGSHPLSCSLSSLETGDCGILVDRKTCLHIKFVVDSPFWGQMNIFFF